MPDESPRTLALRGGEVLDGEGGPARRADVFVRAGRIAAVEPPGAAFSADETLDADGAVVAPGFIDMHAHGDLEPLAAPGAESKLLGGVTAEVCGNCGSTPFPIDGHVPGYLREKGERLRVTVDWTGAAGYFARLRAAPSAIHRAFLCGHGRLRGCVMGASADPAGPDAIRRMRALLADALDAGAWGLSTGLAYPPGCHATTEEIASLCEVAAGRGGLYATHMRSESDAVLEAVDEAVAIARMSGVRLHVSHLKISGEPNWPRVNDLRARLDAARAEGTAISADWYPYEAWNANLDSLLPNWVYEGGTRRLLSRLRDPEMRCRLADHILELGRGGVSWDQVIVGHVSLPEHARFQGRSIADLATELGHTPEDTLFNLILAEGGRAEGFVDAMSRTVQALVFTWPFVSVGSDATARALDGPTAGTFPHPRTYGTFPRVLRRVREEGLLPLPEAVRRMTGLPADQLGLRDRGRIRPGFAADLVVFDPGAVRDTATYREPVHPPEGIRHVVVAGAPAVRDGRPTGSRTGRLLTPGGGEAKAAPAGTARAASAVRAASPGRTENGNEKEA